ncbi:MAG: hypothetical protein GX963_12985 [Bacteroidales bacterium]|nr:hypothetical protein [Bacteroidales bacterium]
MDKIIKEAQELLSENTEWKKRYKDYVVAMSENKDKVILFRKKIKEFYPLYYYISISSIKGVLSLDIRYRGQSVATLKPTTNDIIISTKGKEANNKRDFDCTVELNNDNWTSPKARKFRGFFKNRANSRNKEGNKGNEEHNVESLLLTELLKKKSTSKAILGIQPITYCGIRYAMPTPMKASNNNKLEYAKQYGGGIDILARTGGGGYSTHLTVIEVKDENNSKEPPEDALKQAVQYAVFIRELLRSECGNDWYKIFGFQGSIPQSLKIRVACAMPDDILDKTFTKTVYSIENDVIECHYIYFKYDGQQLSDFQTSFER